MTKRAAAKSRPTVLVRTRPPLKLEIRRTASRRFVATAPQLQLLFSGSASTAGLAMNQLRKGIAEQYRVLKAIPARERSRFQRRLLRLISPHIEECCEDESGGIGEHAPSKTGVHRVVR